MKNSGQAILNNIVEVIDNLLLGDIPDEIVYAESEKDEIKVLCVLVNHLIKTFADARTFMLALSEGQLEVDVPRRNFLVSPFKQLHANLRHLTWQTQQVAKGDLNQHVDFLGEFSKSFNDMIASLKEKKLIEDALAKSEKKLGDIASALGEGVYMLDTEGKLTFMNPEAENLLGWSEDELQGKAISRYIYPQKEGEILKSDSDCPEYKTIHTGETNRALDDIFARRDGTMLPVSYVVTPVMEGEAVVGSVTAFHDITELKHSQEALQRANELLEHQAKTDTLTGIANRMKFNTEVVSEISRAHRYNLPLSMILFDIDHFKHVNDKYGHLAGDSLLVELTKIVATKIRGEDLFARWGGEEFVVLLPHTELQGGEVLADRLRETIETYSFSEINKATCSFGVTQFNGDEKQDAFLRRADQAMYQAKEAGRNCVIAL